MRTGYAFLLKKFSPLFTGRAFATSERPGAYIARFPLFKGVGIRPHVILDPFLPVPETSCFLLSGT